MAIALDQTTNSGYQAASSSYSWTHTCSGNFRALVVSIGFLNLANDVATMTYAGVNFTRLRSDVDGTGAIRTDIYYLINPALGANTLALTLNTASVSGASATSYTGVDKFTVIDAQNGTTGTTGAGGGSASIATTVITEGAWIVDAIATTDTTITVGAGQTQRANITGAVGSLGQSDKQVAAGSQTMQWDNIAGLLNWTMSSFAMLPSTNATTTSTSSTSISSTSTSSTSVSSTSSSVSTSSTSTSTTSVSTSSTSSSISISITTGSTSSTSSSISSTSTSSTSSSTSISSTSSSISSTSVSSTSTSSTSSSTSFSSTSTSFSSTSSSISSTSASISSTSFSSTSSSSSTSTTTLPPPNIDYSYQDQASFTTVQNFYRTGTWVCPANVTSVLVECWGGGGGGGSFSGDGGGGGGGAYARANAVTVVPGTSYTVTVGTGGASVTTGGDSWFSTTGTVLAKGGTGGSTSVSTGSSGGSAGSGVGDINKSGGNGGNGTGSGSGGGGGGGGGAGNLSAGGTGGTGAALSGGVGGAMGATTGGVGGAGDGTGGGAGAIGKSIGGGGGGGTGAGAGGVGGGGAVILTYTSTGLPTSGADLTNKFNIANYSDAAGDDGDYFIEYGSEYMIRNYQYDWTNNTDTIKFTWRGRTTMDTRISPMLIQIFNVNSSAWETLANANTVPPDTDFSVTVTQSTNLSNYYDSLNQVTFRSYQMVI